MSKINASFLLAALLVIGGTVARAQVTIQSATINAELFTATTLYQMMVGNMSAATTVHVEGSVASKDGEPVLDFRSAVYTLGSGTTTLSAARVPMRSLRYGAGPLGRAAQAHQRLPGGSYRWCIRVVAVDAEATDEWCDELVVEDFLQLDLVMPWNGDTIDEVRPALTWSLAGDPSAMAAANIRITVAPMNERSSAMQALASSVPLFSVPRPGYPTLQYPPGAPDLNRGRCYAWQAERVVDGRVVDRSDPWSFCVRERKAPVPLKYVRLDEVEPGTVYPVTDGRIYFRYDEPYGAAAMQCAILTASNERVQPTTVNESGAAATEGARTVGANLFELDLQPYGLGPGSYELVVTDGKGGQRSLRFRIAK